MVVTRSKTGRLPPKIVTAVADEETHIPQRAQAHIMTSNTSNSISRSQLKKSKIVKPKYDHTEKLAILTQMSNVARPRSLFGEYRKKMAGGKLKIAPSAHKISTATNHDPARESLLNGSTNETELSSMKERCSKIRQFAKVKVKDLSKDPYLIKALDDVKAEECAKLGLATGIVNPSKGTYLSKGELGVEVLGMNREIQEILQREISPQKNQLITDLCQIGKSENLLRKIDKQKIAEQLSVERLSQMSATSVEQNIFKGLKAEDYS